MSRTFQRDRLLALLLAHEGCWVPLPFIMALNIAQYNARIWELRHRFKYRIENRIRQVGQERHTEFRLVTRPQEGREHAD